jgi:8-amino-7-oxononanoate synthase
MHFPDVLPKTRLESKLQSRLNSRKDKSLFRQLTTAPPGSADFSSNDFLSLSTSPLLRSAFLAELQRNGSQFPLGSGGSRLLDWNSDYAAELEKSIAEFHNAPSALLWNSGFDANAGFFACLPQPGDVILHDELIHASVHDGMKLSRASQKIAFLHNSIEDLRKILESLVMDSKDIGEGESSVFVAVESVYSMDGDIAPLKEIVDLVDEVLPAGNGHVVVDEAHGTGVLGPRGSGLVCELGLESRMFARLHTFGKSLACGGGRCAESKVVMIILFVCSCRTLFSVGEIIPDQLCETVDLHDVYAFSVAGGYKGVVFSATDWAD